MKKALLMCAFLFPSAPGRGADTALAPRYFPARPLAMVSEIQGSARYRRAQGSQFRPLEVGTRLRAGDVVFVEPGSKALIEQFNGYFRSILSLPESTIHVVTARSEPSTLLPRRLFSNPEDVLEAKANKPKAASDVPMEGELLSGLFDLSSLPQSIPQDQGNSDSAPLSQSTSLRVFMLKQLPLLAPQRDVYLHRSPQGYPLVKFVLGRRQSTPTFATIWRERPRLTRIDMKVVPAGALKFEWKPTDSGEYAVQLLSSDATYRSRLIRIHASPAMDVAIPLPSRIRPGDVVIYPRQRDM